MEVPELPQIGPVAYNDCYITVCLALEEVAKAKPLLTDMLGRGLVSPPLALDMVKQAKEEPRVSLSKYGWLKGAKRDGELPTELAIMRTHMQACVVRSGTQGCFRWFINICGRRT